jgi:pyridoxal phosphate enzyme (YggS family)
VVDVDGVVRRVEGACGRAGRSVDDVTVVAVTKYADLDAARALVAAGIVDLGENHAQQLRDRAPLVPGARWHFIGPLQANKAKYVATFASAFHALERVDVAAALSKRGARLDCYVQVNLAGETTKAGIAAADVGSVLAGCADLPGIHVVGLMTMPPLAATPDDSRPWFRQLAALAADHGLPGLSMGTTADFEVAIEEGATAVRIGSAFRG